MGKFKPIIIMKRILLAICMMAMSALSYGQSNRVSFTFAWLSDVHLNSFAYAEDDLRQSIEDINANPAVDFTILSGDVTEFGDTKEFLLLQEILEGFRKPYLLLPGNHDVNWSENGCTMFNKIFQASHFCYDWQGVRFIGCGAGPSLRMGPPHIPREEILWLDSIVRATPKELPVIFVNHFPLNRDLSNWYEVTDILKTRNVLVTLAGHLHTNRAYDAEGIPAVIGRSSLRREDPIGGYNLVTVNEDSITFCERIIQTETRPAWNVVRLNATAIASSNIPGEKKDTVYYRPDFSINSTYPAVREVWKQKDVTDVASQGSIDGELYIYTNTAGMVHALNARNGETVWTYATGNKIFSAPFPTGGCHFLRRVYSCTGQKTRFRPLEIQHGLPHCSLPYSSKRQCLYRQQQRKILLHPPGKRHAQLGYRRTERLHRVPPGYRPRTHLYRNLGSHVLCHRPENREKSMGIRHRTRKILLSGSLLAHSAALPEEWKSIRTGHSAQFRLLCTRLQPGRRKNPLGIG